MKKIFLACLFLFLVRPALAVEPVSTASQELINKVTKIAETAASLRRTYSGTIKSLGATSIVISTSDADRTVTTNNVTTFYRIRAGNRTEINLKALKVGDDLVAMGTTDPQTSEMTARQIIAKVKRVNLVGSIETIDKGIVTVAGTKVDINDAALKKITAGKITPAKLADFNQEALIFVLAYSADSTSTTLSSLKALVLKP